MKSFFDWLLTGDEPTVDRRRSPRYPAVLNCACLAWREGGRTRESTVRLVNISSMGVLVLGDEIPSDGETTWIRLEEPTPTEWIEARVVQRARSGKVGLDFAGHCPYDFLRAATHGVQRAAPVPPEFADGYWQ